MELNSMALCCNSRRRLPLYCTIMSWESLFLLLLVAAASEFVRTEEERSQRFREQGNANWERNRAVERKERKATQCLRAAEPRGGELEKKEV